MAGGQRLILLNSTWNPESLFGDGGGQDVLPDLLPRLTAELPADEYRLAAVLHPNIWQGHGPGQIRAWLDRARRGGLELIDPVEHWRQALIAADAVIGDFGSVSYYAAALGTPVLLGATGLSRLDPGSPVAAFARRAPRLVPGRPLPGQLEQLLADHHPLPGAAELTTSAPGKSAALLRRSFYELIGIHEPGFPALLDPLPLPPYRPQLISSPLRVGTRRTGPYEVAVERHADPRHEPPGRDGAVHLAVHEDTLDPGALSLADVVLREGPADDPRTGGPQEWAAEVLARHPQASLAAYTTGPDVCTVRTRGGETMRLRTGAGASGPDPAACASALHGWLAGGGQLGKAMANGLTVRTGRTSHRVEITPVR